MTAGAIVCLLNDRSRAFAGVQMTELERGVGGVEMSKVTKRFVTLQRPRSVLSYLFQLLLRHKANNVFLVGLDEIDVRAGHRGTICGSLEQVLKLYELASLYRVGVAPVLAESIGLATSRMSNLCSGEEARLTRSIFQRGAPLGQILRSMHETGVLELDSGVDDVKAFRKTSLHVAQDHVTLRKRNVSDQDVAGQSVNL